GGVVRRGMSLAVAFERAELEQIFDREIPTLGHERIDDRGHVAAGEVPEVAAFPLRVRGIEAHLVEEQHGAEVGDAEGPAGVAGLRVHEKRDDVAAHLERLFGERVRGPVETAPGMVTGRRGFDMSAHRASIESGVNKNWLANRSLGSLAKSSPRPEECQTWRI